MGELWCMLCKNFGENWASYNTVLHSIRIFSTPRWCRLLRSFSVDYKDPLIYIVTYIFGCYCLVLQGAKAWAAIILAEFCHIITHAALFRRGEDYVCELPLGDSSLVMNIHNPITHCVMSQYVFKPCDVIMLLYAVAIIAAWQQHCSTHHHYWMSVTWNGNAFNITGPSWWKDRATGFEILILEFFWRLKKWMHTPSLKHQINLWSVLW